MKANCLKRGKTRVTKSRLVFKDLNLIGLESGASFLNQSQREVRQILCYLGLISTQLNIALSTKLS